VPKDSSNISDSGKQIPADSVWNEEEAPLISALKQDQRK
jgi:hypothetical protein